MSVKSVMTKSEALAAIANLLPVVTDQSTAMAATDCEKLSKLINDLQNAAHKLCPVLSPVDYEPGPSGCELGKYLPNASDSGLDL